MFAYNIKSLVSIKVELNNVILSNKTIVKFCTFSFLKTTKYY